MTPYLFATGILAMLPLLELRFAIPWGFFSWNLPLFQVVVASTIGNILSVGIILWLWPIIAKMAAKHSPVCNTFLQKIFARTRTKHSHKFETWGSIFFVVFVMLPIPGSGGWSGSLVAWLFGIPYWRAMTLLSVGLILGALLVAGMTIGVNESIQAITEFFSMAY